MPYPYSRRETLADAAVHGVSVSGALIGCNLLVVHVTQTRPPIDVAATGVYVFVLIFGFLASAAYHLFPWEKTRPIFHRIDHAAIYLKIAGTYTPLVALIGSAFSYGVLVMVWLVALFGAVAKLSFWSTDARGSLALYLGMGWASVLLIWPMWQTLPGVATALIFVGGGLYTLGTVFFSMRALRYQNAIWHGFVLAASSCFFGAVALGASA